LHDIAIDRVDELPHLFELGRLSSEVRNHDLRCFLARRDTGGSRARLVQSRVDGRQRSHQLLARLAGERIFSRDGLEQVAGVGTYGLDRARKRLKARSANGTSMPDPASIMPLAMKNVSAWVWAITRSWFSALCSMTSHPMRS